MDAIFPYPDEGRAFIGLFMVEKDCQGKGAGSQIIREAAAFIREQGFHTIRLAFARRIRRARPAGGKTALWKPESRATMESMLRS